MGHSESWGVPELGPQSDLQLLPLLRELAPHRRTRDMQRRCDRCWTVSLVD
jgi:hypothetical protein